MDISRYCILGVCVDGLTKPFKSQRSRPFSILNYFIHLKTYKKHNFRNNARSKQTIQLLSDCFTC